VDCFGKAVHLETFRCKHCGGGGEVPEPHENGFDQEVGRKLNWVSPCARMTLLHKFSLDKFLPLIFDDH
jgi:hypothetical protein